MTPGGELGEPRLILGNLLAEADLARLTSDEPRRRRHRPPPGTVLRTASRMAAQLRVFARDSDLLWTPEDGPLEPAPEVLAWCETPDSVRLRARPREPIDPDLLWNTPLRDLLWRLPVAPPAVVAAVHHRAFHLRVAEELGCALPGARTVESLADLDQTLRERTAPARWVVKAPLSAAGRDRHIARHGPALADAKERRTVERLFERHGPLLFEPWMERIADYGCAALLTAGELRIVGFHRQRVDGKGQFAGIDLAADLPDRELGCFRETVEGVAAALRREGYRGPFGVDAWTYRRPDGKAAFHPLGEINARMTFGLVAWAGRPTAPE